MAARTAGNCSPVLDNRRDSDGCLVTFVVIGRNEEDVIASSLESVLRAGEVLSSWECIFVDSASEDDTIKVAARYPITIIRLAPGKNLTPAAGRYVGLLHAKGKYVMFVDADCELHPEFAAKGVAAMESEEEIAAVIGTRGYRYGRGLQDPAGGLEPRMEWWDSHERDVTTTGGVALFRKSALDETGGHNPFMRSEEERELCLRVSKAGYRIRQIPSPMMIHNSSPGQNKFAYGELWRRFLCGFLDGRGQLLRLAAKHRMFSSDYVIDGTRRVLFFLIWLSLGLFCAGVMLVVPNTLFLLSWLACSLVLFGAFWVRVGCFSHASFYSIASCLEAVGLIEGFVRGCRDVREYIRRFEMVKESGKLDADVDAETGFAQDWRCENPGEVSSSSDSAGILLHGCEERIRVLLAGPFPAGEIAGGMEKQLDLFLKSAAAKRLVISTFDTSHGQRPEHSTLGRIVYAPFFVLQFLCSVLKSRAPLLQIRTTGWIVFWKSAVCALIGKLCRRKVILSIHAPDFDDFFNAYGKIGKAAIRWTLEGCDRVIALSESWRVYILKIAPQTQVAVVPNGVEEEYFEAGALNIHRLSKGKKRLFYIGGGSWPRTIEKGFLDILAALRSNGLADECILTAAGAIDPEMKCSTTDISLECPGIVGTKEKVSLFKETDIFVQPSHFENMPNVILEAMAAGVPIVATSVGAIPEMIEEPKGGILVPPEDVEALSAAIKQLVEDQEIRLKMGENNYRRAKQCYRLVSTTERWVNLIYEVGAPKASSSDLPVSRASNS